MNLNSDIETQHIAPLRCKALHVAEWLASRGWASAHHGLRGGTNEAMVASVRGPWQHPHHDGRPWIEWSADKPDTALPAVALALGLPERVVRADFWRWYDARRARPWLYPHTADRHDLRAALWALWNAELAKNPALDPHGAITWALPPPGGL